MYTVIRFQAQKRNAKSLQQVAGILKRIDGSLFEGLDHVPNRFSCSVCEGGTWAKHERAIARFLRKCNLALQKAAVSKVSVDFDVAIEPEDFSKRAYIETFLAPRLLQRLAERRVGLVFTYYRGPSNK